MSTEIERKKNELYSNVLLTIGLIVFIGGVVYSKVLVDNVKVSHKNEINFNKEYVEKNPDSIEIINKFNQCKLDVSQGRLSVAEGCKNHVLKNENEKQKEKLADYFLSKENYENNLKKK